jgi:hypothetical protein
MDRGLCFLRSEEARPRSDIIKKSKGKQFHVVFQAPHTWLAIMTTCRLVKAPSLQSLQLGPPSLTGSAARSPVAWFQVSGPQSLRSAACELMDKKEPRSQLMRPRYSCPVIRLFKAR